MINYSVALESTSYIRNETKWVPWDAALTNLNYLVGVLSETRPAYKYLQVNLLINCPTPPPVLTRLKFQFL